MFNFPPAFQRGVDPNKISWDSHERDFVTYGQIFGNCELLEHHDQHSDLITSDYSITRFNRCKSLDTQESINTLAGYLSHASSKVSYLDGKNVNVGAGGFGFTIGGSFNSMVTYDEDFRKERLDIASGQYSVLYSQAECYAYGITRKSSLATRPLFDPDFVSSVEVLAKHYYDTRPQQIEAGLYFMRQFGLAYFVRAIFGSSVTIERWTKLVTRSSNSNSVQDVCNRRTQESNSIAFIFGALLLPRFVPMNKH